jgi:alanine racemase
MLYHGVPASLANSAGIFIGDTAHFDLARPGAALYGINPTPGRDNPMRNVLTLSGRILQVRKVAQGESVGYGATWNAKRASRVAVAALGYADGLLRAGSGLDRKAGGSAVVARKRCPTCPTMRCAAATARRSSARISRSTRSPLPRARSLTRCWCGSVRVVIWPIAAARAG